MRGFCLEENLENLEIPVDVDKKEKHTTLFLCGVMFRGILDAVRLRIVSLAVRGTGTAWFLRPAFSAPPPPVGAMAGPHPLFERRDIAGENLNLIFSAGKTEEECRNIQLWQPA